MRPIHLSDKPDSSSEPFLPELLYGSERVRAFLLRLEPGQGLPVRSDSEEMLCYLLQGTATLTIGDREHDASAGDLAAAAPGQVRGIRARDRVVALWIHLSAQSRGHAGT